MIARESGCDNVFMSRLSVCPVCALTFESLVIETMYGFIFNISMSNSYNIQVTWSKSQSQKQKRDMWAYSQMVCLRLKGNLVAKKSLNVVCNFLTVIWHDTGLWASKTLVAL